MRQAVKAVIFYDEKILLIQEQRSKKSSFWTLPGGGLAEDESHIEALKRELYEELSIQPKDIECTKYLSNCQYNHKTSARKSKYYLYFVSLSKTATIEPNEPEVLTAQFFLPSELPRKTLNSIKKHIETEVRLVEKEFC